MNNLAPMKNCPGGVQGNLNWMPGYILIIFKGESYLAISKIVSHFKHGQYRETKNEIRCLSFEQKRKFFLKS